MIYICFLIRFFSEIILFFSYLDLLCIRSLKWSILLIIFYLFVELYLLEYFFSLFRRMTECMAMNILIFLRYLVLVDLRKLLIFGLFLFLANIIGKLLMHFVERYFIRMIHIGILFFSNTLIYIIINSI